jgi:hypothetical protein
MNGKIFEFIHKYSLLLSFLISPRMMLRSRHLPSGTGPTSPVQLHNIAIVAPRTLYGVPNVLQFGGIQEYRAEW